MKENKALLILGSILFTLIILQQVSAIGVTPGRTTINYESSLTKEVQFSVINTEHKGMTVVMYVRGELASYIKLGEKTAKFANGEESKTFTYTLNLPADSQDLGTPGVKKGEIVVLEVPENEKIITEDGQEIIVLDNPSVSAKIAVISQVYVYVLHPGKYLEGTVDVITADDGTARFLLPITSRGKLGIGTAGATIDIYTALNEKIKTINTNSISIESEERKELYAEWDYASEGINPGRYRAVATITYDGQTTYAEKNFEIGSKDVEVEDIEINNFKLGEIAKFNILVNNNYNAEIKDLTVQIQVYNQEGQVMADFASQNYEIPPLSKAEVVSYWDTVGVSAGKYKGKLSIKYEDRLVERPIEIEVSNNGIEVVGFTGKAIIDTGSAFNTTNILIGLVVLLIIINAVWFFLFLRKKRNNTGRL